MSEKVIDSLQLTGRMISDSSILRYLTRQIAPEVAYDNVLIASNAPTGMVPGWQLREDVEELTDREVPYVYIRSKQKKGGHKENITGNQNNSLIKDGDRAVLVEVIGDDYDFTERVLRSSELLKDAGYQSRDVVSIAHPQKESKERLNSSGLTVHSLMSFEELNELIKKGVEKSIAKKPNYGRLSSDDVSRIIIEKGALEVRDLEGGEEPFLYSSGLWGPGYAMVKGLAGQPDAMNKFAWELAIRSKDKDFDFIIGNVTGGVIIAQQTRNYLEALREEKIPYVYADGMRLLEGNVVNGNIVGDKGNPNIKKGDTGLVVEELVNTAGTTAGSIIYARNSGYKVKDAVTIFNYENPLALKRMEEHDFNLTSLTTLNGTLNLAEKEKLFEQRAVIDYRFFMSNPIEYQKKWNLTPLKRGGTE